MVYFNSFVSNEGRGSEQPGGGLVENDFNPLTGEPKLETAVNSKIMALGREYCEKGAYRQGGALDYLNQSHKLLAQISQTEYMELWIPLGIMADLKRRSNL